MVLCYYNIYITLTDGGYSTQEDILIVPIDLLQFSSHPSTVQRVLQHFEKVTSCRSIKAIGLFKEYEIII